MTTTPDAASLSLTARDYAILRGIALHRPMAPRGYYTLLNSKLSSAEVLESVAPDIAALESLVRYRVGAGNTQEHKLIIGSFEPLTGSTLSVRTIVGLALIGTRPGDTVDLPGSDGTRLLVEAVTPPASNRVSLGRQG